jgi:hypothetical protein
MGWLEWVEVGWLGVEFDWNGGGLGREFLMLEGALGLDRLNPVEGGGEGVEPGESDRHERAGRGRRRPSNEFAADTPNALETRWPGMEAVSAGLLWRAPDSSWPLDACRPWAAPFLEGGSWR